MTLEQIVAEVKLNAFLQLHEHCRTCRFYEAGLFDHRCISEWGANWRLSDDEGCCETHEFAEPVLAAELDRLKNEHYEAFKELWLSGIEE